jgi:hypothetical protein
MAVHARPAGLGRLRCTINSWLEEISFQTAVAASVAVFLVIVAAVIALVSGHGTVAGAARSDPAGTPGTSAAMPAAPSAPRAIAIPAASPPAPAPAAPAHAATPRGVTTTSPATSRSGQRDHARLGLAVSHGRRSHWRRSHQHGRH